MSESNPIKTWHLIFLVVLVVVAGGTKIYNSLWTKATIKVGGVEMRVLVADTPAHRFKGWSDKKDMGKYGGMLFVFPESGRHAMVMRDMHFPLDIIWIYGDKIVDIAPNLAPEPGVPEDQLVVYRERTDSTLVLEVPAGFMEQTGVKIGDTVEIVK